MSFVNGVVEWLNKSHLRPHELLGDLAAMSDCFVVECDSLILETIQHEIVDWSGSAGEYLQVAYLVESFLSELVQRGANFRVIIFKLTQAAFWSALPASHKSTASPQSVLLLRNAVVNHLKRNTSLPVSEFDDWTCLEFQAFLTTVRPSFALISPCASIYPSERARMTTENGFPIGLVMAMISLKIFSKSVALAFLSELQFKDRFIWAESVQPFNMAEHSELNEQVEAKLLPHLHRVYNALVGKEVFRSTIDPEFTEVNSDNIISQMNVAKQVLHADFDGYTKSDAETLVQSIASNSIFDSASWRYIVAAVASHFYLKANQQDKEAHSLVKAFLVQTVLANHMAPQWRPRSNLGSASQHPASFRAHMDQLTIHLARVADVVSTLPNTTSKEWDLIDIVDSRLILSILTIVESTGPIGGTEALGFSQAMQNELAALWSVTASGQTSDIDLTASTPLGAFLPFNSDLAVSSDSSNSDSLSAQLIPIRSTLIDRMIQDEDRPVVKESDYVRWYKDKEPARKQIESYPWKPGRALDFSALMYHDKEYEERRTNKNYSTTFHAHWAKLAQSLEARPTQTAVLQPKVLMRDESTQEQILAQLKAKIELEAKPKTPLQETRDKEISRVKSLVVSWRSSPIPKRISTLAGFVPTTVTAYFEWLYSLLDVHIEQYRLLKIEKESAAKSTAPSDSIQFVQQRLKALQRDEIFDQCVSMIVQCGVGMLEYRGTSLLDPQSAVMKRLTDILDALGLTSLHSPPARKETEVPANVETFPAGEDTLASSSRFQLARMGPWMKRDVGAVSDPRAERLLDSWQIDVLNCIDSYKSCLVVAPTSAGKSFMGFHAMSRVLETEDGVLVYVAPTKALVNQVVAEVYSKFSKATSSPGTVICGAFTREMRIAPIYARILVTVPQCLEILLLARELAGPGGWRSKLKWVIFDEIHCINMDDGAIWERLLPLVPCPFMALSATVGDVDNFQKWLNVLAESKQEYASERTPIVFSPGKKEEPISAATAKKPIHPKLAARAAKQQGGGKNKHKKDAAKEAAKEQVSEVQEVATTDSSSVPFPGYVTEPFKFIKYDHRYSDLYKYIMVPRFFMDGKLYTARDPKPEKVGTVKILSEIRAMHPWMGLRTDRFTGGTAPTSSFSPKECLQVYEAMAKYAHQATQSPPQLTLRRPLSPSFLGSLLALKPENFFDDGSVIDQRSMRQYEARVKAIFIQCAKEYEDMAEKVLQDLTGDMLQEIEEATSAGIPLGRDLGSPEFLLESLANMAEGLHDQAWLPAIVFNFDPDFCERLAIALHNALIEKENQRRNSPEYRQARLKYLEEMKLWEAEQKRRERAAKKKNKRNDEDLEKEGDPTTDMPVDPDIELVEGTTFTRDGEVEPLDDLKREMTNLKNRGINGLLIDAIRRGIGVHHNGLDKKYRQAVEHHFRTGQIKILFSTETLALGINMPCRTTVFAGDSPNLTPLQYRQMSGRAGRRGYDPLGRVIFWGIPIQRIGFLEGASLAPIRGQFPLSSSFNLRGIVLSTADLTGNKKKGQTDDGTVEEKPLHPGAKKAAASKAKAASAKKAAPSPKPTKASWDDSSDEEDEIAFIKHKPAAVKASWDDSSEDEEDDIAQPAAPEDPVLVDDAKLELVPGATEVFTSLQHVYQHSLYLHQHPEMQSQLDIHTRCSLQYLARLGLISPLGKPVGLAGIACHLNWAEPANIVFARFLTTDIIQKICTNDRTSMDDKVEQLLLLTAHLFSRVPVPPHRAGIFHEQLQSRSEQSKHSTLSHCNHALFLPTLPAEQQTVIDEHNRECLEILNSVILPYAKSRKPFTSAAGIERWLQLSELSHLSKNPAETPSGGLFAKVAEARIDVVARSPLAALGGYGDLFKTQADLRTMRHGLSAADFGMLVNEDAHGAPQPLNAYLYDLFKFGNYEWLKKYNMFADADLFANCFDYVSNLKTLRSALFHRSKSPGDDAIYRVFSKLTKEFYTKFISVFKVKKREFAYLVVRGVEDYRGDLQKHILTKTRISVPFVRKYPTLKFRDYMFQIPCRDESDKARLVELFSEWANPNWWIDEGDSDDEDQDITYV